MPNILFSKEFIAKEQSLIFLTYVKPVILSSCTHIIFNEKKDEEILKILKETFEIAKKEKTNLLEIQISVMSLWNLFYKKYSSYFQEIEQEKKSISYTRVRIMIQYIIENYMYQISLNDIAYSCNISQNEALRCFRTIIQMTPFEYLINYRIQKAKQLLMTTDDTVKSIAIKVFIENITYFNRIFKKDVEKHQRNIETI